MTKPKVFIADLVHNQRIHNYCAPLNVGYVAAAVEAAIGKGTVDLRLFKFPDVLIEALDDKPTILALSNYDWNVNLNKVIIGHARAKNPDVFVVMGGPNIRRGEEGARQFLVEHPEIDAYVVKEGEEAFANLVVHMLGKAGSLRQTLIGERVVLPQVAYLDQAGGLVHGPLCASANLATIPHPSPWLNGWMDPFIDLASFPLSPIIETNRGCPYTCTYCTAAREMDAGGKTVRSFPIDTVMAELDYIFTRSKNPFYLFIGDSNVGGLDRDVGIVTEIRRLADIHGNCVAVELASSKNMVKRNLEIYRILGNLSIPSFAQQTFDVDVGVHIGRKNVPLDTVNELVSNCHAMGARISTDLLVGLPTESRDTHVNSVKQAYDCGFDKVQTSDIRLLKGTPMETDEQRETYGLVEKVRVIPSAFGVYGGVKAIEFEHCIRETKAMSAEDFLELRLFHAHIFVAINLEIGRPLIDFATRRGFHAIDLLNAMSHLPPEKDFPALRAYFDFYLERARSEWFDQEALAEAHYFQPAMFDRLMNEGFPKLNYDYGARLAIDAAVKADYFAWMGANIRRVLPDIDAGLIDEIAQFASNRVMLFPFDGAAKSQTLSPTAQDELSSYVSGGAEIELIPNPQSLALFRKSVDMYGGDSNLGLAVQLTLQNSSKALIRTARVR